MSRDSLPPLGKREKGTRRKNKNKRDSVTVISMTNSRRNTCDMIPCFLVV